MIRPLESDEPRAAAHRLGPVRTNARGRMQARGDDRTDDRGESLLEIVITVVIIAVTVGALVAGLGSVAAAGNAHRVGVQADTVMRNYAEATKSAVRTCSDGDTWRSEYRPPDGFRVSMSPDDSSCPSVKEARRIDLTVESSTGTRQVLTIVVRTP